MRSRKKYVKQMGSELMANFIVNNEPISVSVGVRRVRFTHFITSQVEEVREGEGVGEISELHISLHVAGGDHRQNRHVK